MMRPVLIKTNVDSKVTWWWWRKGRRGGGLTLHELGLLFIEPLECLVQGSDIF